MTIRVEDLLADGATIDGRSVNVRMHNVVSPSPSDSGIVIGLPETAAVVAVIDPGGTIDSAIRLIRQLAFAEVETHRAAGEIAAHDEWSQVLDVTRLLEDLVTRARAARRVKP